MHAIGIDNYVAGSRCQIRFDRWCDRSPGRLGLIRTPLGSLQLMAEPIFSERRLILHGLHVQNVDLLPNALGAANLRRLVEIAMEG